jgi:uncharacterized protein (DUF2147 family)
MKTIAGIFLVSIISLNAISQGSGDAIVGKWMTIEGNLRVEVYKQNDDFKAKVIWFKDTDDKSRPMNERMDEKNPDKALRSRKWIGMEVLINLRYYPDDDDWDNGKIYDPNTGRQWSSEAWMTKDNQLKVTGYWLFKFISQTKTFIRI